MLYLLPGPAHNPKMLAAFIGRVEMLVIGASCKMNKLDGNDTPRVLA